jgi:tripartite-type tricarboxylate transporter receptor subunit TctC
VIGVVATPVLVLATPALAASSLHEALQWARGQRGGLRWASSGRGTTGHLVLAHTRQATATPIVHVPYKGGGQQISDALGGHFELLSSNLGSQQLQHVRQGRLRAFALGAPERSSALPEVPTLAELGLPQANLVSTFGLFAPGGTAPALLQAINAACQRALDEPLLRQRLGSIGNLPLGGPPQALAQQIRQEAASARQLWARWRQHDTF